MPYRMTQVVSSLLAGFVISTITHADQFAPPGYLETPVSAGASNQGIGYPNTHMALPSGYGNNSGFMPAPQTRTNTPYSSAPYYQNQPAYPGGYFPQGAYQSSPYPQGPFVGQMPSPYSRPGQYGYYPNQQQWRPGPPANGNNNSFSMVPWDHMPGGKMPDFNPFSQGPFNNMPSQTYNTPAKDWAVRQFGDVWEEAVNAPHNMGPMPGNIQAPSVSLPNPVDLGDQIGSSSATIAEEAPEVIQGWFD